MATSPAPVTEIGYTQAPNYNWWLYDQETTPELQWPQSIYVFDQMRKTDSQVTSVLRAMTLPVRRTPWRIDPNGASPEVTQLVADDLGLPVVGQPATAPPRSKDRFSWLEHLRLALLMLPFGHSFFEQVYRIDEDGKRAHLRKLAQRPAKTIENIGVAPDGGLVSITQYWTTGDSRPQAIPVDRLVAYVHEREAGNWLGTSILRPAYKNWLLKDRLLRVQAQTIERNGMGVPLYTAAENETSLAAGFAMAKAWRSGEAAGAAIPFGAEMVLRGVEGTLPDADPAIRYHDEQIGRAVLAHFLNLGTQTGAWALGTTFADFFTLSLQTLAQQIADTATQHIIEDLVDVNFGTEQPAPRLVFDEIGSRQAATAAAIKTLVDAGVLHPDQVLEEASRQQYGLPAADPATSLPIPGQEPVVAGGPKELAAAAADDVQDARDAATDALTLALFELDEPRPVIADSTFESHHKRGHDGKFVKMVDRLIHALKTHREGGKSGDPFEGYDREQLRRVARDRKLTLRRGASRDEIAKALADDLGDGHAPDKPATPAKKAAPKTPDKSAATGPEARIAELRGMSKVDARDALDNMTRPEVYALAQHLGEKGQSKARKRELVDLVLTHHGADEERADAPGAVDGIASGDFSGLRSVGPGQGSNPGGVFEASDGSRWYVKAARTEQHASNEALAAALYREAGIDVPVVTRGSGAPGLGDGPQTATRMVDGATPDLRRRLSDSDYLAEIQEGFAVDAWLANWDVTGSGFDNIVSGSDGQPHRIDVGGALLFRARGGPKGDAFADTVGEWDTLRSARTSPEGSRVFGDMTDADLAASAARVDAVSPDRVRVLVAEHGLDAGVADTLVARRQDILDRARPAGVGSPKPDAPAALTGDVALSATPVRLGLFAAGGLSGMPGLSDMERREIEGTLLAYRGSAFFQINRKLRGQELPPDQRTPMSLAEIDRQVATIDRAMDASPLTADVQVRRRVDRLERVFGSHAAGDMTGLEWHEGGYVSTTTDPAVFPADPDDDDVAMLHIRVPKGTGGVQLSDAEHESELMLERGLHLRVVSDSGRVSDADRRSGAVRSLTVEVVPRDDSRGGKAQAGPKPPGDGLPGNGRGPASDGHGTDPAAKGLDAGVAPSPKTKAAPKAAEPDTKAPPAGYTGPTYTLPAGVKRADVDEYRELSARQAAGTLDVEDYDQLYAIADVLPKSVRQRVAQDVQIDESFETWRQRNAPGESVEQLHAEMAEATKKAFADKRVAVRMTPTGLTRLLADGRFKTFHEHGDSESHGPASRLASEESIFGLPPDADATTRPIYGYVMVEGERPAGDADADALSQYGRIQVVFRDDVRSRTTAMWGDSLDNKQFGRPSPIDDPEWRSFTPSTGGIIGRWLSGEDRDPADPDFQKATYAEAEIHGGVGVSDIAEVLLPPDSSPTLKRRLDSAGIPWRVPSESPAPAVPKKAAPRAPRRAAAPKVADKADEPAPPTVAPPTDLTAFARANGIEVPNEARLVVGRANDRLSRGESPAAVVGYLRGQLDGYESEVIDLNNRILYGEGGDDDLLGAFDFDATEEPDTSLLEAELLRERAAMSAVQALVDALDRTVERSGPPSVSPYHPVSGPDVAHLAEAVASGVSSREDLGGGNIADTSIVTFRNGDRAVRKVSLLNLGDMDSTHQRDAEHLGSLVARAIGANAPAVYVQEEEDRSVYMDLVEGRVASAVIGGGVPGPEYTDTRGGRLLGLTDVLTSNIDRHAGNWIVSPSGDVVGIDHGTLWNPQVATNPTIPTRLGDPGPFAAHFIRHRRDGSRSWSRHDMTRSELDAIKLRLEALRPEFARMSRERWLDFSLARLDALMGRSRGA